MAAQERRPVALLGATGAVGQRFVALLAQHPWFELREVLASSRSAGKSYAEAVQWNLCAPLPESAGKLVIGAAGEPVQAQLCFSALDNSVAHGLELQLAQAGKFVCSNAAAWRLDAQVPLVVPEVNPEHLALLDSQTEWRGSIMTNPNCSTIGLSLALKPLQRAFGLESVSVVSMQAMSGAGQPTSATLELLANVVPFIPGEEQKLERETVKILGDLVAGKPTCIESAPIQLAAQCNRVPVMEGHMLSVTVEFAQAASEAQLLAAWKQFRGLPQELDLPSAPSPVVVLHTDPMGPQPRLHVDAGAGMAIHVGRVRQRSERSWQFVTLSHNTLRGAAGGALLLAELAQATGRL